MVLIHAESRGVLATEWTKDPFMASKKLKAAPFISKKGFLSAATLRSGPRSVLDMPRPRQHKYVRSKTLDIATQLDLRTAGNPLLPSAKCNYLRPDQDKACPLKNCVKRLFSQ